MAGFHFHLHWCQLDLSCANIFSSSDPILASSVFSNQSENIVLGRPQPFFPWICFFYNESRLKMWPIHLFCRLLMVSIISHSASTICNTSSFVLCSDHDTFIIRLHINIANASSRRISSFRKVHVSLPYNTVLQILSPYVSSDLGWAIAACGLCSWWRLLFPT